MLLQLWARSTEIPKGAAAAYDAEGNLWSASRSESGGLLLIKEPNAGKRLFASEQLMKAESDLAKAVRLERQLKTSHGKDAEARHAEVVAEIRRLDEAVKILRVQATATQEQIQFPLDLSNLQAVHS